MYSDPKETRLGLTLGLTAFFIWGVAPLFFKQIEHIPSTEIIVHRVLWSVALLLLLIKIWRPKGQRLWVGKRQLGLLTIAATLISSNWILFVWAVNSGQILATSLGYFINPILTLLLGTLVLKESLTRIQFIAAALAIIAIAIQWYQLGHLPWVSLSLASTFAIYGLIKKNIKVGSAHGMFIETLIILPIAIIYGVYLFSQDLHHFKLDSPFDMSFLVGAGVITLLPLMLFSAATQKIPLVWVGFMQYIAPSMAFIIAVFVYHEPLEPTRLTTFVLIWVGLAALTTEGWIRSRRRRALR